MSDSAAGPIKPVIAAMIGIVAFRKLRDVKTNGSTPFTVFPSSRAGVTDPSCSLLYPSNCAVQGSDICAKVFAICAQVAIWT